VAYLISGHYRQPLAFGELQMEEAVARVERLRNFFRANAGPGSPEPGSGPAQRIEAFREALADDFNTPRGMAEVFELVAEANRGVVPGAAEAVAAMLELVGLGSIAAGQDATDPAAEKLLQERQDARAAKDFARADEIRDRLAALGWEVRDSADGPRIVRR
jgi:cysteinyl-tRNA synthetase